MEGGGGSREVSAADNINCATEKWFYRFEMMRRVDVDSESMVAEPEMMFVVQPGKTKGPPTLAIASYGPVTRLAGFRSIQIGEGERTRRMLSKRKKILLKRNRGKPAEGKCL